MEGKWGLIRTIGKPYAMEILEILLKKPSRFGELTICPIEKTRSKRLKELVKDGLVDTITKQVKDRVFVHYRLTSVGKGIVRRLVDRVK